MVNCFRFRLLCTCAPAPLSSSGATMGPILLGVKLPRHNDSERIIGLSTWGPQIHSGTYT